MSTSRPDDESLALNTASINRLTCRKEACRFVNKIQHSKFTSPPFQKTRMGDYDEVYYDKWGNKHKVKYGYYHKPSKTALWVGLAIGLACLILFGVAIWYYLRRKRRQREAIEKAPIAYPAAAMYSAQVPAPLQPAYNPVQPHNPMQPQHAVYQAQPAHPTPITAPPMQAYPAPAQTQPMNYLNQPMSAPNLPASPAQPFSAASSN